MLKFILNWKANRELIEKQKSHIDTLAHKIQMLNEKIRNARSPDAEEQFHKGLGMPFIDFDNVDEEGYPNHFLHGLSEAERRSAISRLNEFYTDPWFSKLTAYLKNLYGNYAVRKATTDNVKLGRFAIVGIRKLEQELENAHVEFSERRKVEDDSEIVLSEEQ